MLDQRQRSYLKKAIPSVAFVAGLCCFTPVVLVLLGLGSISFAASLSDTLYGQYKWAFRGVALVFLLLSIWWYFYKVENICTFDAAKRNRNRIINMIAIAVIIAIIVYVIWLYVVVHYLGVLLKIW
jgi:hypothetical protein